MYRETGTPVTSAPQPSSLAPQPLCRDEAEAIAPPFPPLSASEHAALHANEDPIAEWVEELAPTTEP
ncbi:hypothetical protein V6245_08975 [Salinibacterium amurskyense]|uniref:hypothetical protein n=1 Tax=Salinibacterium amurskyense TaxID=205941 RepID=UPI00311F4B23